MPAPAPDSEVSLPPSVWRALNASIDQRVDRIIRFRRRLHATPEVSGQEKATTALIAESLAEYGFEPRIGQDETGLIVDIDLGAESGTFVATRSELDCVEVNDDKQVPYASTRPGLCHACGHDVHSTVQLGAALIIAEHLDELRTHRFAHNLRLIFQPAEENATGARSMIQQGALDGVEAIIALHVDPYLDAGLVGMRHGAMTAACKGFQIHVRGRGGHSARPFEAIDPLPAATNIVSQFYQLCPRSMDSRYPLALTVSSINCGTSFNVIPDEAVVRGTLRAARLEDIDAVQHRMQAVCQGVGTATGSDVKLEFLIHAPATMNDPHLVGVLAGVAQDTLGVDSLTWIDVPSLGAEDFAFYQELIPGAFVRLGAGLSDGRVRRPLHSSLFDIDEAALPVGVRLMARSGLQLALSFTGRQV